MSVELGPGSGWTPDMDADVETVENPARGCGHLKASNAYLRADVSALGYLPAFCVFTKPAEAGGGETDEEGRPVLSPIPFKEEMGQGYQGINGTEYLLHVEDRWDVTPVGYDPDQMASRHVVKGVYDEREEWPDSEVQRHIDRVRHTGLGDDETHYGRMKSGRAVDLVMRAGKTHYPEPWDYIDEAVVHGVNKGIGVTQNRKPPLVNPGRTRCFIVHPNALGEARPGIVGFTYLTRVIYTLDEDGELPEYAREYVDAGLMDSVQVGEPEEREEDIAEHHTRLDEFWSADGDSADDSTDGPEPSFGCDVKACGADEPVSLRRPEGVYACPEGHVHDPTTHAAVPCGNESCGGLARLYDSGQVHCSDCGLRQKNERVLAEELVEAGQ